MCVLLAPVSLCFCRLYPEEQAAMKDPAEALLEPGEYKKSDMFFEYRIKEGEEVGVQTVHWRACCSVCTHSPAGRGDPPYGILSSQPSWSLSLDISSLAYRMLSSPGRVSDLHRIPLSPAPS